jgi:diadenosine tetraphosphate (Ap4A) HIT family hydrolase
MPLISERVEQARTGANDKVICRLSSGWAVIGDVQFLTGYCLLLPDPVVPSLNDLSEPARARFLSDMARIGDAVLKVTNAQRINYEILGNSEPELHAHIFPRYATEATERRRMPVWFYDWSTAQPYDEAIHGSLRKQLKEALAPSGASST